MYKRQNQTQKLVIPQGTVMPGEAVVVEIPRRFRRAPIIVVKKRPGELGRARADLHFIEAPNDLAYPANFPQNRYQATQPTCPGALPLPQQQQLQMPQQQICPGLAMPQLMPQQQICSGSAVPQLCPSFYAASGSECPGQLNLQKEEMMEKLMFSRSLEEFQKARRLFLGSTNMMRGRLSQCPSTLSCGLSCYSCDSFDSFD